MSDEQVMWQPFREPVRNTAMRTVGIALAVGGVLAAARGRAAYWPVASVLVLWFSLGGHFVELLFLNVMRPQLPTGRRVQVGARLAVWFAGGVVLGLGMAWTAMVLVGRGMGRWPGWWVWGAGFVVMELVVHGVMRWRGLANFYDGRG